jgi:4'-phosphopantetheinyl transferase
MTISERRAMTVPLSTRQRAERLTTLWCVKEAYVKAIGEGVGFGMERIDVDLDDEGTLRGVRVDERPLSDSSWNVQVGILDGEYIWACVHESDQTSSSSEKIIPKMIDHQDIINSLLPS